VQDSTITPIELTTNYNRWQNEYINSDFQSINGNPAKNRLTSRSKTVTQIEFTGIVSKLQLPSKADVRLANDLETLQAVQYFAEIIRDGTTSPQQLSHFLLDSGENIENSI
ncbi:hypothetical protein, partial [Pseudomonas aeruginosa]|uniref:hypothetical protein n=1 Tax=Pseudomonas aeruginosa TaxID=287 RepID=UPI001E4E2E9F